MLSLELSDRELSLLAEAQASLNPLDVLDKHDEAVEIKDLTMAAEPGEEVLPSAPHIADLREQVARAAHYLNGIRELMSVIDELRLAHQRVSTKSVVLQSTWEGTLSAPSQLGAWQKEIARRLACFSQLNEAIAVLGKTARLTADGSVLPGLSQALTVARESVSLLQAPYFESGQYLVRLKQVLGYAIGYLKETLALRLARYDFVQAMEPFTCWPQVSAMAQVWPELEPQLAQAIEVFAAARFTAFNAALKAYAMEISAKQTNHLSPLITEYANRLQDELIIFERYFAGAQVYAIRHLESLAVPLLRYCRSVIDQKQVEVVFDPAGFNPLVCEQVSRIIAIIRDYAQSVSK